MEVSRKGRVVQKTELKPGQCILFRSAETCVGVVANYEGSVTVVNILRSSSREARPAPKLEEIGTSHAVVLEGTQFVTSLAIEDVSFAAFPKLGPGTVLLDDHDDTYLTCAPLYPPSELLAVNLNSGDVVDAEKPKLVATSRAWRIVQRELDDYIDIVTA